MALYRGPILSWRIVENVPLLKDEVKYKSFFENSSDAMLIIDNGVFVDCNKATIEMLGYDEKRDIVNRKPSELSPEFQSDGRSSLEKASEMIHHAKRYGHHRFEWDHLRKDGSVITVEVSLTAIKKESGNLLHTVWRDLTERKRTEKALQESERLFHALIDQAADAIFLHDLKGQILDVNRCAVDSLGYSREELLTMTVADVDIDFGGGDYEKNFWSKITPGKSVRVEGRHRRKNGTLFPVEINLSLVELKGGSAILALSRDITERKRVEDIIKGRLNSLIRPESETDGLSIEDLFDLEEIQEVQDAFAKATGVASIITDTQGRPITKPSNFCRLCRDIIRKTEKGLANCMCSDAALGRVNPKGPIIQPCLSGGLWDGGASIMVGDKHIGNWLIGQVRNEQQDEAGMLEYARKIGADEEAFRAALAEVPVMSTEQFGQVCRALFVMAKQLSRLAFQNVQQARAIHARDKIEGALRESEEKVRLLLNSTAEAIYGVDTQGKCIFCNPSCIKMLGYEKESDLLEKKIHDLIHHSRVDGTDYPEKDCKVYQAFRRGEGVHVDDEVLWRADGSNFFAEYWSYPMRKGKELVGSVVTFLDITERKRAEEALRESDRIKSEFIKTVAHEFRTPLASIQGFSELLQTHAQISQEEQREFLGYIHERSLALASLVDDILDITRIEAGEGLLLKVFPCSVKKIYREVEPFLKTQGKTHQLEVNLTQETTVLNVDKGKIGQVLENLLSNAVKFSPKGSLIRIQGDLVVEGYRFSIVDEGIGMTPEQVARVFDKFYRVDNSDTAVGGVGLGMYIAREIVEAHNGRIWVESKAGKGTTVNFNVPLCRMVTKNEPERGIDEKDPDCRRPD